MATAVINGASLRYEVLGTAGPWVAISPGGRRKLENNRPLAQRIAAAGFRVLIHDRRNCGQSDLLFGSAMQEHAVWADDLHALLLRLDAHTAFVGGASSGARLALHYALRYPESVQGLLLWRVTGGATAARHLADQYYGDYVVLAERGGMAAVCESEQFRELIAERPAARDELMRITREKFIAGMSDWRDQFLGLADQEVLGASEVQLRGLAVPVLVIPGNDIIHVRAAGAALQRLVPGCECHDIMPSGPDLDEIPFDLWDSKESEILGIFIDFMRRHSASQRG